MFFQYCVDMDLTCLDIIFIADTEEDGPKRKLSVSFRFREYPCTFQFYAFFINLDINFILESFVHPGTDRQSLLIGITCQHLLKTQKYCSVKKFMSLVFSVCL